MTSWMVVVAQEARRDAAFSDRSSPLSVGHGIVAVAAPIVAGGASSGIDPNMSQVVRCVSGVRHPVNLSLLGDHRPVAVQSERAKRDGPGFREGLGGRLFVGGASTTGGPLRVFRLCGGDQPWPALTPIARHPARRRVAFGVSSSARSRRYPPRPLSE